jgi:DNA polymerase II small subunit
LCVCPETKISGIFLIIKEDALNSPEKIMTYLLKHRHLAPSHSSTQYFPAEEDSLIIKKIPDIFVSGHTHKSAVSYYNNILIVSIASWESKTAYQEKMGNEPDFCKVPMFNLKTRTIKILDFEDEKTEAEK